MTYLFRCLRYCALAAGLVAGACGEDAHDGVAPGPSNPAPSGGAAVARIEPEGATAPVDNDAVIRFVLNSQRHGLQDNDAEAYLRPWADDAHIIVSRRREPGPHDVSIGMDAIRFKARLRSAEEPSGVRFKHVRPTLVVTGDKAVLNVRTEASQTGFVGVADEIFLLRRTEQGWRIYENRVWEVQRTFDSIVTTFDDNLYRQRDEEIAALGWRTPPRQRAIVLMEAGRGAEAYDVIKAAAAMPNPSADLLSMLGGLANRVGEVDACERAYRRAAALDPELSGIPALFRAGGAASGTTGR